MVKHLPINEEDTRNADLLHWSGRCPGERNGYPLRYSCLGNPTDRGAWLQSTGLQELDMTEWLNTHTDNSYITASSNARKWSRFFRPVLRLVFFFSRENFNRRFYLFIYLFMLFLPFFFFYLWWILSYIEMKQPRVYMCSPSQSPLPPPSPPAPSRSSQCTRSERLSHASNLGWWSVSP